MKKRITVYRIVRDPRFRRLVPTDEPAFSEERDRRWAFDARRSAHEWVELEMQPSNEDGEEPDIWEVVPGAFALEKRAAYELCASVEETQPVVRQLRVGSRRLDVVNSTLCIDCLDDERTHFAADGSIRKGSFDASELAISLFKVPQTRDRELYTLDGFDSENDFKTLVERFEFTGVVFEPLWSGESWMDA